MSTLKANTIFFLYVKKGIKNVNNKDDVDSSIIAIESKEMNTWKIAGPCSKQLFTMYPCDLI